jgi:hypothetical protein
MKKKNQKDGENYSLKIQFTLFFLLFVIALYAVIIITTMQQLNGITETISAQLGLPIVKEAAALIDGDAFERLSKSLDPADPYYDSLRRRMLALKEESLCLYLYTMAPSSEAETVYRYIVDGSAIPEDREHFSPLGMEEDIRSYRKYALDTMETQKPQISGIDYTSHWGWVITTYMPIINSSGVSVGFVGCDIRAENVYKGLWSRIIQQLMISSIFVFLGLVAYLYMVNGVNKQNQRLLALKEKAEETFQALQNERDTITAMKDALKVGIFLMDKNFVIQNHYSRYLETVLGIKDLEGKKFTDLMADSITQKEITSLMEYFVLLFNRALVSNRAFNASLMENINPIQELTYTNPATGEKKELQWTFAPVDQGNGKLFILGNIQDITVEKALRKKLTEEEEKRREETSFILNLLRSDPVILQDLEKIKQRRTVSSGTGIIIDKILALKAGA